MSLIKAYPNSTSGPTDAKVITCTTSGTKVALDVSIADSLPSETLTSITRSVVTVTAGAALQVTAVTSQQFIRIVPIEPGTVYWAPTNAVSSTNSEGFTSANPMNIQYNGDVFLRLAAAASDVDCVLYQGA